MKYAADAERRKLSLRISYCEDHDRGYGRMNNSDKTRNERFSVLEKDIMSEADALREITREIEKNWIDPAADLIREELYHCARIMEEQAAAAGKRISDPETGQQEGT